MDESRDICEREKDYEKVCGELLHEGGRLPECELRHDIGYEAA